MIECPSAINALAAATIGTRSGHRGRASFLTEEIIERDHYTCRNPECGCRNLRVQAHHVHPRSLGGSDLLDNGVCVCKCCHLRLIHTGRISVTRVGDALVWRYPGRVVVAL